MDTSGIKWSGEISEPRRTAAAAAEIAMLAMAAVLIGLLLPSVRVHGNQLTLSLDWMAVAGEAVLAHVGWGFGVYVPILLGFYAIVVGGQLLSSREERRTRQRLALAAELITAALVPAMILAMVASVAEPRYVGSLFVIVPIAGVVLFLAIQLGGFNVFDRHDRLRAAERSKERAYAQVRGLRRRSRRPRWLVLTANVAAASVVGLIPALLLSPSYLALPSFCLYLLIAGGLLLAGVPTAEARYNWGDRVSLVALLTLTVCVYVLVGTAVMELLTGDQALLGTGVGILAVMATIAASSLFPRGARSRFLLDWSINGAAAAAAARSAAKVHRRAVHEIRELAAHHEASMSRPPGSLSQRLRAAVGTLTQSGVS